MGWLFWGVLYVVVLVVQRHGERIKQLSRDLYKSFLEALSGRARTTVSSSQQENRDSDQLPASPVRTPKDAMKDSDDRGRITASHGSGARRSSLHGFDGELDDDDDDDYTGTDGISPLTQYTGGKSNTSCSKHGFYDDEDDHRYSVEGRGPSSQYMYSPSVNPTLGKTGKLFPTSPAAASLGSKGLDSISPLSSASYSSLRRRMARQKKDVDTVFGAHGTTPPHTAATATAATADNDNDNDKENSHTSSTNANVMQQMLELYNRSNSAALDLLRRDEVREQELSQAADRRKILLETNSQTQQMLMKKYEEQEAMVEKERESKVKEATSMIQDGASSAIDISRLSALLKEVRVHSLPLPDPADAPKMEKLMIACGAILDDTKRLFELVQGNDMVEKETVDELHRVVKSALATRMLKAGNQHVQHAKAFVDECLHQRALEAKEEAEERDRKERLKVVVPPIAGLDNLLADVRADNFLQGKDISDLLSFGVALCEVMATSQVNMSKEQRLLLWRTVLEAVVNAAVARKAETEMLEFTIVLFGTFYSLKKSHKKYSIGCYRMLSEVLLGLSPILIPKVSTLALPEGAAAQCLQSREARLRAVTLYASLTAIEVETSTSLVDAWIWLTRLTKLLRRSVTQLGQQQQQQQQQQQKSSSASVDDIKGSILEACRAIRNYLRLAGPLLLLKYRDSLLNPQGGILAILRNIAKDVAMIDEVAKAGASANKTIDEKLFNAAANLTKMADSAILTGVFDAVPFHPVCFLHAQMSGAFTASMKSKVAEQRSTPEYKAQERVRNSIPHRLLRVPGLLTKEGKVELIKQLVVDVSQQQPELLGCVLTTVAEEIVKKCCDDQFIHTNLANPLEIATIITDLCASKLGSSFGNLIKNEFNIICPMTVPSLDGKIKIERMQKVICTFALCCVQDGNSLSLGDAWEWLANVTNLASQRTLITADVAEALNTFLRVVSERMLQSYGSPFKQVVLSLSEKVLPLVEESIEKKRLKEFLGQFQKGKVAPIFSTNTI